MMSGGGARCGGSPWGRSSSGRPWGRDGKASSEQGRARRRSAAELQASSGGRAAWCWARLLSRSDNQRALAAAGIRNHVIESETRDKIPELEELEFEAKSAKDSAWYDIAISLLFDFILADLVPSSWRF